MHSRTLAVFVGGLSLVLGAWSALGDLPAMGMAAGAVGLVAGLMALIPEHAPIAHVAAVDAPSTEAQPSGAGVSAGDLARRHEDVVGDPRHPSALPVGSSEDDIAGLAAAGALGVAGRGGEGGELLTDPVTELFSEAYLRVALDSRLASARRHLRPVAIALMDVTEGLPEDLAVPAPAERVADAIRETVREADIACRLNDGTFAVILEDTPENGAVWTVERIRRNLVSRFGHHTLWAGVACYPAHAFESRELMTQAHLALEAAREWKQDRIEVAAAD